MRIHGRNKALVGVLAAAFIAVLPGTAFAGHDLGIYKVEKQVDLTSDDYEVDVSCGKNDYALDGMWRIDHADQDDDDLYVTSIGRAVDVAQSYPLDLPLYDSDSHRESYHFYFNKNAIGRAQAKVWVVCLKSKTEVDGHQHNININEFGPTNDADGTFTSPSCPANQFVAQPGYKINQAGDADPYIGHLFESWPQDIRTWSWVMDLSQQTSATSVDFYWACVERKVPLAGGEKHKLVYRLQGPENNTLPKKVSTKRISCAAHYKAVVAGFSLQPMGFMNDPNPEFSPPLLVPKWWYLGMDPQPKSRDFRFLNSDSVVAPNQAKLKAICLNYRTT